MIAFFAANIGTIGVGSVLAGIVSAIVASLVKEKRQGKSISCSACSSCGNCQRACCK
ncbi:MAG: FeoB-associated Cys-rich membrane protein [Clostridiales bacterium]|jgi:L-lactate utilization protein LutB|nr:FeoB-associated Cys-rich membrane protein [Clostridiales bacterium]MDR2749043.1 FeoB-associated Cys-rich membrane protein [Clostridiales bacterium]